MPAATVSADAVTRAVSPGVDPRRFGSSTDDAAIFLEDTIDRTTVQCISDSPSAIAILTPQRLPPRCGVECAAEALVVATPSRLTASHVWAAASALFTPPQASEKENVSPRTSQSARRRSAIKPRAHSTPLQACDPHGAVGGADNTGAEPCTAVQLRFSHSPPPKPYPTTTATAAGAVHDAGIDSSHIRAHSTRDDVQHTASPSPSPAAAAPPRASSPEAMVALSDYRRLERDRDRRQLMYEHQKLLYETMAEKHDAVYKSLQEKIVEVVALSSRNEESKRFIRQLKREIAESRTRVMEIQNRALEETRLERSTRARYEALIAEQERQHAEMVARQATKTAAMESLLKDLSCMKSEGARMHVGQLDALLRAAYAKNTALFADLLAQGRQMDLLYASNADLAKQLEQVRKEKAAVERAMGDERRRMTRETERFLAQIAEQQKFILDLSQLLLREVDERAAGEAHGVRGQRRGDEKRGGDAVSVGQGLARIAAFLLDTHRHPDDEDEDEDDEEDGKRDSVESRQSRSDSRSSGQSVGPRLVLNDDDDVVGDDENAEEVRRALRIVRPMPAHVAGANAGEGEDCRSDGIAIAVTGRAQSSSSSSAASEAQRPVLTEYSQRGCTAASFRTKSVSRHRRSASAQARRTAAVNEPPGVQARSIPRRPPCTAGNSASEDRGPSGTAGVPTIPTAHMLHTRPTAAVSTGVVCMRAASSREAGTARHSARPVAARSAAREEDENDDEEEENDEEDEKDDMPRLAPQLTRLAVSSTRPPLMAYERNILTAPHKACNAHSTDKDGSEGLLSSRATVGNGLIHTRTTSRPRR